MAEPESVCRPSDMDLSLGLKLHRQADGDIIVTIGNASGRHMGCPDVEICTPGAGGSKSPETWRALGRLFEAMQADAEGRSLSPALLPPGAIVVSDTEETRERIARKLNATHREFAQTPNSLCYDCDCPDQDDNAPPPFDEMCDGCKSSQMEEASAVLAALLEARP